MLFFSKIYAHFFLYCVLFDEFFYLKIQLLFSLFLEKKGWAFFFGVVPLGNP